jgi:hypothetical protein
MTKSRRTFVHSIHASGRLRAITGAPSIPDP